MINFYNYFFYHPASIILLSMCVMKFMRTESSFHSINIIASSLISAFILYNLPDENIFNLFGNIVSYSGQIPSKIIGFAFLICLTAAALNSLAHGRINEVVCGSLYGAFSLICLLASDLISMFISLEFMAVFSAIIIFQGGQKKSIISAKKYFITHLLSSNMLLIAIIHIYMINQSFEIVYIGDIFSQRIYSITILLIGLLGLLINIAIFPFTGWMVNYYQDATASGFIYLISFTTKLSLILIFKLFAGFELLKYAGLMMIIHSCSKVIFEQEIRRILCYFSIISMGFVLIGFSASNPQLRDLTIYYLFISILAILLMSLANNIGALSFKSNLIAKLAYITGMLALLAAPGSFIFTLKTQVTNHFKSDQIIYTIILFSVSIIGFSFPWCEIFTRPQRFLNNVGNKLSQKVTIIIGLFMIALTLFGDIIFGVDVSAHDGNVLKQLIIISFSIFLALILNYKRCTTIPINLIETLGNLIFSARKFLDQKKSFESNELITFSNLENQYHKFSSRIHNQQTAIGIVFILLTVLLFVFIIS